MVVLVDPSVTPRVAQTIITSTMVGLHSYGMCVVVSHEYG